jgi:hypothetical protein
MVRNVVQILLTLGAVFMFWLPIQEYLILRTVTGELAALDEFLGEFEIIDPKKTHIRALKVTRPLEYAWRIYLPENITLARHESYFLDGHGGGSGNSEVLRSHGTPARQFVLSYKLSVESNYLAISSRGDDFGGTRFSLMDNPARLAVLQNELNAANLRVRQFANSQTMQLEEGQKTQLLSMEKLLAEELDTPVKPLLEVRIAPVTATIANLKSATEAEKKMRSLARMNFWKD